MGTNLLWHKCFLPRGSSIAVDVVNNPYWLDLNLKWPFVCRWHCEQHSTAASARLLWPRVEVTNGAMLVNRTIWAAKLYRDCKQAALHGSVPESTTLRGHQYGEVIAEQQSSNFAGYIRGPVRHLPYMPRICSYPSFVRICNQKLLASVSTKCRNGRRRCLFIHSYHFGREVRSISY